MRYPRRNISSLERLTKSRNIPSASDYFFNTKKPARQESEDTKARKDINETVIKMIKEGKNDIQIELYLKDLYPNYSEYILKMISHQFSKINASKSENSKDDKTGEGR